MLLIRSVQVDKFSVSLAESPLVVSGGNNNRTFIARNGAHMNVHGLLVGDSDHQVAGKGEMVEPVFVRTSTDSPSLIYEESYQYLVDCCPRLQNSTIPFGNWASSVGTLIDTALPLPEVRTQSIIISRFALEQALLRLVSNALKLSLWEILREWVFGPSRAALMAQPQEEVKLNSLYDARDNQIPFRWVGGCVKMKVGGMPQTSAKLVNKLVADLDESHEDERKWLRIDANQSWSVDQATEFGNALWDRAVAAIEYVEEPLKVTSITDLRRGLHQLVSDCGVWSKIPIALDESLLFDGSDALLQMNPSMPIVHKPFIHGLRDSPIVGKCRKRITITCTFETGVGLSFLVALAAAINPNNYHGIHPLPEMAVIDESTKSFSSSIQPWEKGGRSIALKDLV